MRLDGRKDIQSEKSLRSVLFEELKAHILPLYRRIIKYIERTPTNTYTHFVKSFSLFQIVFTAARILWV